MPFKSIIRALPMALLAFVLSACAIGRMPATLPPMPTKEAVVNTQAPVRLLPTRTPTPGPDVDYDGVAFHFDPSLGVASGITIAADGEDVGSPDWMLPSRALFSVNGYPLQGSSREPVIVVFPIDELKGFNDVGIEYVNEVKALIDDQPASGDIEGAVPQLAVLDDTEIFHAQLKYLDFKNGSGYRYITIFASDLRPVTNEDLVYVFQGITADGSAFVSIILPISQSDLHDREAGLTNSEVDALLNDYNGYLDGIAKDLDIVDDDTFKPTLSALDNLIGTFSVDLELGDITETQEPQ